MTADAYDVVVIGAGAVGENAAGYARQHDLSVAVIERELVGGEVSHDHDHDLAATAGGALHGRDTAGRGHLVIDAARRTLVGATFTGPHAAELLHAAPVAIVGGVTLDRLWHAVPAFPTLSEVWLRLLEAERGA